MDEVLDNPAGRLVAFLDATRQVAKTGVQPGTTSAQLLAEVLRVRKDDQAALFARLGDLLALPGEVREAVFASPGVSNTFTEVLPEAEKYLDNLVGNLAQQGIQQVPDTLFVALRLCSEQLSLVASEAIPAVEDLMKVRSDLDDLINEVAEADLDDALAQFMMGHLHELLEAIDRFRVAGVVPVSDAVSHIIGDLQLRVMTGQDIEGSDGSQAFVTRFWRVVSRVADLVNIAAGTAAITAGSMQALMPGPHPPH